jgi:hypothetical protein
MYWDVVKSFFFFGVDSSRVSSSSGLKENILQRACTWTSIQKCALTIPPTLFDYKNQ